MAAGGGGGGGTGTSISTGGGGAALPTVIVYLNGTEAGYEITNISNHNSETLHLSSNTKTINITVNFITPTSAGITANNKAYTLTLDNPTVLADPNNYTYYAELTGISYLPIQHTITLLVYGRPNTPISTQIAQPAPNTIVPTTTIILPTATTIQPTSSTIPANTVVSSNTPSSNVTLLPIGIIIIIAVLGLVYYQATRKGRKPEVRHRAGKNSERGKTR